MSGSIDTGSSFGSNLNVQLVNVIIKSMNRNSYKYRNGNDDRGVTTFIIARHKKPAHDFIVV